MSPRYPNHHTRNPPSHSLLGGYCVRHLQSLNWIVIDEVHELADSKRGSQLSLALERIRDLIGKDFQMIGLSATVGSPDKVAQFLVGSQRPVEIIRVSVAKWLTCRLFIPNQPKRTYASPLKSTPTQKSRRDCALSATI